VNGQQVVSGNKNASNFNFEGGYVIGGGHYGGYLNADIQEFIIINKDVTDIEQQRIHSYLALKYGITLDQTGAGATDGDYLASDGSVFWDESQNAGYDNDIAGIARDDASGLDQRVSQSSNDDALVTFALDNNFTDANNDAARTTAHVADISAMTWGNNDGAISWTSTGAPSDREILERTWKIDEVGSVGNTFLSIADKWASWH